MVNHIQLDYTQYNLDTPAIVIVIVPYVYIASSFRAYAVRRATSYAVRFYMEDIDDDL